jgi:hypothetical protein
MATCPRYIQIIRDNEKIGNSLIKINNNFTNLKNILCSLYERVVNTVNIRTFFYYGPNSSIDISSNLQDGLPSRPSNQTIESFVNDKEQLNVPSYSRKKDEVYVIYQKTGYKAVQQTRTTTGSVTVVAPPGGWSPPQYVIPWSTTTPELYTVYAPVFIIWRLIHNGSSYRTVPGFPKFTQALTNSSANWKQPQTWTTY